MSKQFNGILEVDAERGVIYFHHETGRTILRIGHLPTPIPVKPTELVDIIWNVGVNYLPGEGSNAEPIGRRFWQSGCRHCDYVTGPYYEDEHEDAEEVSAGALSIHLAEEHGVTA
jgi:hypothetical protein